MTKRGILPEDAKHNLGILRFILREKDLLSSCANKELELREVQVLMVTRQTPTACSLQPNTPLGLPVFPEPNVQGHLLLFKAMKSSRNADHH